MGKIDVTIEILSPIHLSSGQANVNIDADIVRDEFGLPYFPAKRFKGLLYESAVEVVEMFALSGLATEESSPLEKIFHRQSESEVQLIVPNFFIRPLAEYEQLCAEWKYLQWKFSEIFTSTAILDAFTTLRYQTRLEDGVTAKGSLRNLRVLDAGLTFFGEITLLNGDEEILNLLALAIKNLNSAGTKRNRGFGQIKCMANFDGIDAEEIARKIFAKVA